MDDAEAWRAALQSVLPGLPVRVFPRFGDPDLVRYANARGPRSIHDPVNKARSRRVKGNDGREAGGSTLDDQHPDPH